MIVEIFNGMCQDKEVHRIVKNATTHKSFSNPDAQIYDFSIQETGEVLEIINLEKGCFRIRSSQKLIIDMRKVNII